ncbi:MAG: nucleotidyltransferase domain-containing protein [Methanomassiliicoccales archaeon]
MNEISEIDIGEILEITKLHPLKVRNIYLFGSRVYGSSKETSDYDIMVVAAHVLSKDQFSDGKYNISVHVPNVFEDDLRAHDIIALECLWAPDFARLQEKIDYARTFVLDIGKFKVKLLSQSHDAWYRAKMSMRESDILRGQKRVGHALKILLFGIQIANFGKIVDFTEVSSLYNEIAQSNQFEWEYFREKYLPIKRELEQKFMSQTLT